MLIANESQWRTEDLIEMVRRIENTDGFARENFYESTLLLFKTSRAKPRKWNKDEKVPAADHITHGRASERYWNTRLVVIRSTDKIAADVLDRLANSDVQQDMSPDDLKLLVEETAHAIGGWRGKTRCNFSWVTTLPMRIGGPSKRSPIAVEREIEALQNEQNRIRRCAREQIALLDTKIEKVRARKKPD